ncbi:type II toxin-antitoxin system VapC family toxin [Ruania zhangjianzhongii]|uniref:type II toxin-antitoxin system VapC family toxin n=1 Tax=Ruania zhangjianzhongii TaxID=2603206 RepID=UPI0011C7AF67|nr:type II toxin-antitoxin system VapC family toxin [Ruania zhangjianzhongii]
MIRYLDTSAALKLLVDEPFADLLADSLEDSMARGDDVVASWLLYTELHCAAYRRRGIAAESVNAVLDALALIDLEREDMIRAGTSAWGLRSADALHLATALRVQADELLTYDRELLQVAGRAGVRCVAPGS